ncbi:ATP-binding protein [Altericista sp. CCNU0014]|uniref:ATP-binding protein n=1 Tax=Altericista sp. CCNU0014 TaxID=3082949 RepID=UPI0038501B0E
MSGLSNTEAAAIKLQQLSTQAAALLVYRDLIDDDLSQTYLNLLALLAQPETSKAAILQAYSRWFYAVSKTASGWLDWIEAKILSADNPFARQAQLRPLAELPPGLTQAASHDLNLLQRWAIAGPSLIQAALSTLAMPELPMVQTLEPKDLERSPFFATLTWAETLPALAKHYQQYGIGRFATAKALRWRNGTLEGIGNPEQIQLTDLVGYDWQQTALKQNTEALLAGHTALNVLLYGSRGSGKSALIKALMTEYGDRGLRLIELNKADMMHLPDVIEQIRSSVLKFIIFIDDLSFEDEENSYKALKVVLEGNLTARPANVAVYATSNRRHLIREFFDDRPRPSSADEVHAWDTVQEKLSLSDRFGLTLTFEPADQNTYLKIVRHLAQRARIDLPDETLTHQALQWTVRHNVRSGRTARQFIDYLRGQKS